VAPLLKLNFVQNRPLDLHKVAFDNKYNNTLVKLMALQILVYLETPFSIFLSYFDELESSKVIIGTLPFIWLIATFSWNIL